MDTTLPIPRRRDISITDELALEPLPAEAVQSLRENTESGDPQAIEALAAIQRDALYRNILTEMDDDELRI